MELSIDLFCLVCLSFLHGTTAGGQFNLFHAITESYEGAKHYCARQNRVLARVDTSSRHRKIKNLKPFMDGHFWIGLKGNGPPPPPGKGADSGRLPENQPGPGEPGNEPSPDEESTSGNFTWADKTELDEYTNWASGFPGHTAGLDCVRMRSDNYEWETFNCTEQLNFLCEDPYYKPSSTVSTGTKVKGIFMGIGVIGGLLTLICLLLQLPCCRANVTDKIADIGFGTSDFDQKAIVH